MSDEPGETRGVSAGEADRLFRLLADFDRLVVAVSGGADSMALLHLVAAWATRRSPLPEIVVATVDHGLRDGSAAEALNVGRAAAALDLKHVVKTNDEPPGLTPFSQEWARGLRYRLLSEVAGADLGAGEHAAIVTAHHADDQAETVLMRLARGSGVDGLGAMRARRDLEPRISLLRPLLSVGKQRLIATLTERGADWIEDPSNENVRFERVRLRERAQAREGLGLTSDALGLVARRAARASRALEAIVSSLVEANDVVVVSPLGYVTIDWPGLLRKSAEIRLRVLARVLHSVGGRSEPISLGNLEAITEQVDWVAPLGKTIAHCAILAGNGGRLHIVREIGRSVPAPVACTPGQSFAWDGRFRLTGGATLPVGATISWLGLDGLAAAQRLGATLPVAPRAALATLPALWVGTALASAPSLGLHPEHFHIEAFVLGNGQRNLGE